MPLFIAGRGVRTSGASIAAQTISHSAAATFWQMDVQRLELLEYKLKCDDICASMTHVGGGQGRWDDHGACGRS